MPLWLTPKDSFGKQDSKLNFAVGSIAFFPFAGSDGAGTAGIVYGLGTYGSRDSNISVGLGWGFAATREDSFLGAVPQ